MGLYTRDARHDKAFGDGVLHQLGGGVVGDDPFTAPDLASLSEAWIRGFRAAEGASAWTISTAYSIGQIVTNDGNVYACVTAGTSAGSGGPTGQGERIADNDVVWQYQNSGTDVDLTRAGLTRDGEQGYVAVV